MAVETKEELESKIKKHELHLRNLKDQDHPDQREIARIELEISRLKNLKGDEGVHPQSAVEMPEATSFDAENAPEPEVIGHNEETRKDPVGKGDDKTDTIEIKKTDDKK